MTDATPSTPENSLLFPAFMYGDKTTCRRKMKAEAKKWAKCYAEGRPFPEPKLIPIPPGSVLFMDESTSHWVGSGYSTMAPNVVNVSADPKGEGLNIQWRGYLFWYLQLEIELTAKLSREACFAFRRAFVKSVTRSAWGAISAAAIESLLRSIDLTVPRIEGVLRHWDALDTLKYVGFDERPISLTEFMTYQFYGNVAMWVDQPTGELRTDLATAIAQMRKAPDDEIHRRILQRLRECVDTEPDLKHREWLKSPGILEMGLEERSKYGRDQYDDLTSGYWREYRNFLAWLAKDYGPGSERFDPSFGAKP